MDRSVFGLLVGLGLAVAHSSPAQPPVEQTASIPLCPGLTIVTAINQAEGDYESIKTIESVTDEAVRLKYSAERMVSDVFSNDPPKLERTYVTRTVRRADLTSSMLYLQQFTADLPEVIPETTAIGTSAAVLKALKEKGEAEIGIFFNFFPNKPGLDPNVRPNLWDFRIVARVRRASAAPVMLPVTVNDTRVGLPAIHATGDFAGDKSEFFFLDDERNPLTLKFRIGIDALKDRAALLAAVGQKLSPDRDVLQIVKISYRCAPPPPLPGGDGGAGTLPGGGGGAEGAGGSALETALEKTRRADVYDIFFTFNSDVIREESEPTLKEIAAVLKKHVDWRLGIEGHTDSIASDSFNLDLSRRRAAAVKDALVKRHGVAAARLTTAGFGESRPKDTNDTLEGRARNRRVELVRSGG
jgi:outer membrane protein OmpA-like peptidoglycan-associated protein